MRALTRFGTSVSTIMVMAASTAALGAGMAAASGPVPMSAVLRNCDFSIVGTAVQLPRTFLGHGTTVFRTSGSTVTADVHMDISNQSSGHYDVALIQLPRPSSATCGPGDPGTTYSSIDIDPSGQANVTVSAPVQQGATGAWVMVTSPGPHNQVPGEFYTTEYVAPV